MSFDEQGNSFDAVVLGAGISGLVSASILANLGTKRILLIDEYPTLGGNHKSVNIGNYTFDIGSFFFQDDSPLLNHFPELMQRYLPGMYKTGRLVRPGKIAKYPIDLRSDLLAGGWFGVPRVFFSLMAGRIASDPKRSALSFVRFWIGEQYGRQSGLLNYMRRFYGVEPDSIEGVFASKRMGWIASNANLKSVMRSLLNRSTKPTNRELVRPKEGFSSLYETVNSALQLRGVTVKLNVFPISIDKKDSNGDIVVHTDVGDFKTQLLVSTIPVDKALDLCGITTDVKLESVNLVSLFYSFKGVRGFSDNVLYNFSEDGIWKRLTVHSDFYGIADGREYFSVENINRHKPGDVENLNSQFKEHVKSYGLFLGDLRLEGHLITENVYPVYLDGATRAAEKALLALRKHGVLSFGRQGGFDYQPTARVSTLVAEEMLGKSTRSM